MFRHIKSHTQSNVSRSNRNDLIKHDSNTGHKKNNHFLCEMLMHQIFISQQHSFIQHSKEQIQSRSLYWHTSKLENQFRLET